MVSGKDKLRQKIGGRRSTRQMYADKRSDQPIELDTLRLDGGTQPREAYDEQVLSEYADRMELDDRGFVGLGAIAMNKAVIGSDAMLAAGAMLTEGKVMGARELWGGRPARKMRDLDDAAIAGMRIGVAHYAENAKAHAAAVDAATQG